MREGGGEAQYGEYSVESSYSTQGRPAPERAPAAAAARQTPAGGQSKKGRRREAAEKRRGSGGGGAPDAVDTAAEMAALQARAKP